LIHEPEPSTSNGLPILVVGADSLIGSATMNWLIRAGAPAVGTTRRPARVDKTQLYLDLAGPSESWPQLPKVGAAVICAAITGLATCETDPDRSWRVNVESTLRIAESLLAEGTYVVFFSSSAVFDGSRPRTLASDPTTGRSLYGKQKQAVEKHLLSLPGPIGIIRPTKVLGPTTPLIKNWIRDLRCGKRITAFSDMMVAPISTDHVIVVSMRMLEDRLAGIVQISASRDVTYADAALRLASRIGCDTSLVEAISYRSAGHSPENVPAHTSLDTTRLRTELGLADPDPYDVLDALIASV
jgi:dTDP-4-dehydrorhamnose reductase